MGNPAESVQGAPRRQRTGNEAFQGTGREVEGGIQERMDLGNVPLSGGSPREEGQCGLGSKNGRTSTRDEAQRESTCLTSQRPWVPSQHGKINK